MAENVKSVSYRRNRNYKSHFTWTYELNRDLYRCYKKARDDPSIGYMNRLKLYWDEIHPEFDYFTSKQLRQQATFVERKNLVMESEYTTNNHSNDALNYVNNVVESSINSSETLVCVECETTNSDTSLTSECERNAHMNTTLLPTDTIECSNENSDVNHEHAELRNELKSCFNDNYEKFHKMPLQERPYLTRVDKKPTDDTVNIVESLAREHLLTIKEPSYWDINVIMYTATVTIKEQLNDLKEVKVKRGTETPAPKWITQLEGKIDRLRKKIGHLDAVVKCIVANKFTAHQRQLKAKLTKMYGNSKRQTFEYKLITLKQELKATCEKLRYQKRLHQRKIINRKFAYNQKTVFREMGGQQIKVKEAPTKEEVEEFWKKIWCEEKEYNRGAAWLEELKNEYCVNVTPKEYEINRELFDKVVGKLQNGKSPGRDLLVGYWYKKFDFYRDALVNLFRKTMEGIIDIPRWLALALTRLLAKNERTNQAKNYRPIACQNLMYKLYTSCLNQFLQDHCEINDVVTDEQAGGKKGVWGCAEQLLVNKAVLTEVKQQRRNLITVWLDYKKAFDSVPHSWMLEALRLAKVPDKIVSAVERLTKLWATRLTLNAETISMTSSVLDFACGIFQGDSLSVLLFILSVNPLSFLLKKSKGYMMGVGENRNSSITHNFFVDDLKLYASDINSIKKQLDLVTTFSKDIGMEFGQDKCSYLMIERGKIVNQDENLDINGISISPVVDGECYKYLGIDENISYNGAVNKERVLKEYYTRVRKIWESELSAFNKCISHNSFAVPVLVPTFGILDWTLEDIRAIDIKTRKILTTTGNFHRNSDVDRLYIKRNQGGRGLRSVQTAFECRIISLTKHLENNKDRNTNMQRIYIQEENNIRRVGKELLQKYDIEDVPKSDPKSSAKSYQESKMKELQSTYQKKIMHGYIAKKLEADENIDKSSSQSWLKDRYVTSHFEGYAFAIQDQEINTKYLMHKRDKDASKPPKCDNRCRLCRVSVEDITHVISSCPKMSVRYYLPLRHDVVARTLYNAIIQKECHEVKYKVCDEKESIYTCGNKEYWWNVPLKTSAKSKHNRPDFLLWDKDKKLCTVVEISCPADVNVSSKVTEKENIYSVLMRNLQLTYVDYTFMFAPIIVGALGYVTKCLQSNLEKLGFSKQEQKRLTRIMQAQSVTGTVKICKTFQKFSI